MKFLIFRTDKIGDLILSLSVPQGLKKKFPECKIFMCINPLYKDIIKNHPDIDAIIGWKGLKRTFSLVKEENFDYAVHLFPTLNTSLLTLFAGIPQRIGTGYRVYSFLYNKKIYMHRKECKFHEAEYNVLLLKKAGFDIPFVFPRIYLEKEERNKILKKFENYKRPFLCIHPESRGSAPNWSYGNYQKLINILDFNGTIFITGTKKTFEIKNKKNTVDLRGKMNLSEFINFISICDMVFAPSTGTIHIASALDIKVIAIFSEKIPFTPRRWGPLSKKSKVLVVKDKNLDVIEPEKVKQEINNLILK